MVFQQIQRLGLVKISNVDVEVVLKKSLAALEAVGPAGMDHYLLHSLLEPVRTMILRSELAVSSPEPEPEVYQLHGILQAQHHEDKDELEIDRTSHKVQRLAKVLQSHHDRAVIASAPNPTTYQAIIFVQQRHIASALAHLLNHLRIVSTWVSAKTLVGHGTFRSSGVDVAQDFKRQQDIVSAFRKGEFNVLISTSVGEEGLDFPACDLVVRFDPLLTMIGYVQSRGRARHKQSKYVVMIDETSPQDREKYLVSSPPPSWPPRRFGLGESFRAR
jgi:endoribonuclease Dicer